jgi:predicted dehydrogenase
MTEHIGIIVNGATGRMARTQHLVNSLLPIRQDGVLLSNGKRLVPELLLVGRNADTLKSLAAELGIEKWSTDLTGALADPNYPIYFDGVTTAARPNNVLRAIAAGKHIYCEKPTAATASAALALARAAEAAGVRHGVVQDKLWAPGLFKLHQLAKTGFFGKILSVRIEGCYWVFEGDVQPAQRPSWNYRAKDGGGIILDMMPHYHYLLEDIVAPVERLVCLGATHIDRRWDEHGRPYQADADDACYAIMQLEGGIVAQIMSSWCVRVRRDDIGIMTIDGVNGSAVAGFNHCWIQPRLATPKAQWSLDASKPVDFYADWQQIPDTAPYKNAFRLQWELLLRHVVEGGTFPWNLRRAAGGVQLAELSIQSWKSGGWVDVPRIAA